MSGRAAQHGYLGALKSAGALDALIRTQAANRPTVGPHSTGPLEEFFHTLDQTIGDRAARMTNKRRADALLKLLAAQRNGWVDEHHWAEIIRAHLIKRRGLAPAQRKHTGPRISKNPALELKPRTHPTPVISTLSDTRRMFYLTKPHRHPEDLEPVCA